MSVIIQLLEKIGQYSEFRYADAEQLAKLMADIDPALVDAVIAGDQDALEAMLNVRRKIVCMIYPADEPNPEQPGDEEEEASKIQKAC